MTFVINAQNYRLYFNYSGGDRVVTLGTFGSAHVELKAPNSSQPVFRQQIVGSGAVLSLRVPAQHFIEIDAPAGGVQVEIQSVL